MLVFLGSTLWCYAFGAFTSNEPNVFLWEEFSRALVMYMPVAITAIFYVVTYSNSATREKKSRY